ncbi:MAG: 4a-hydroxytetrahydrobiopterin dehydratase [Nanoarchaeota archaeon]
MNLGEIQKKMEKLKDWALEGSSIIKDVTFSDFKQALEFVNKVGEIAEKNNHHPSIILDYNFVHLTLTTHSEHTLTDKDFIVAEEIDKLDGTA